MHSEAAVITTTAKVFFLVIKAHSSFKEVSGSKLSPHTGSRQAKNFKFEVVDHLWHASINEERQYLYIKSKLPNVFETRWTVNRTR
jgi:hypothetical protein